MQQHSIDPGRRVLAGCGVAAILSPTLAWGRPPAAAAPAVPLALDCPPTVDVTRYLVSEKLDGVRGLWTGRELRFRSGQPVHAPAWFTAALPPQPLDGELWMARGRFEALAAAVRREQPQDAEWREVRYCIFELPQASGAFQARFEAIQALVRQAGPGPLLAVPQRTLPDGAELRRWLDEVVAGGGEGLVLHRADAPYLTGRSGALLKLKPLDDADAVVIGHVAGRGKYLGQVGALRVRTEAGVVFEVGTGLSDAERRAPPPLGSTITFTHRGFTRHGVPRFASFLRVRADA